MITNKLVDVDLARRLKYVGFHEPTTNCYTSDNGYYWNPLYYPAYKWDVIESNAWLKHYMYCIHECKGSDNPNYAFIDFNQDILQRRDLPHMLSMPTYHEVSDWLRTKYGIVINIEQLSKDNYKYKISYLFKEEHNDWSSDVSDYFEAYKRAIISSINIIENHGLHKIENFGIYN